MSKFTIPVDAGYMFDFLCIYEVKLQKKGGDQAILNFTECVGHISDQIGRELLTEILNSEEYRRLVDVNSQLFDLVDEVKKNTCKGKELDDQVYLRYLAKVALQKKFFPEQSVKEQKFGY